MKMNVRSWHCRVREGDERNLHKWPTKAKAVPQQLRQTLILVKE
jgi:hypothetical protein